LFERDFTLRKYRELCEAIKESGFTTLRIKDFMSRGGDNCIVIRHDVDKYKRPYCALTMALIEKEYDIQSTYYFRIKDQIIEPEIIKKFARLGHEIGYHYEVLDKAKGDKKKAIQIFKHELGEFRKLVQVETIAMHGNPLCSWLNSDLWKDYDFREFEILGEPYLSISYNDVIYLSDTGRSWDGRYSVKDVVNRNNSGNFRSTNDVIEALKKHELSKACLVVHPSRWNDNYAPWINELISQSFKNFAKAGIITFRNLSFHRKKI
jgi:hypothetical protein